MFNYFYMGDVILTWPCGKVTKRCMERIVKADSVHDAYAKLTDVILAEEVFGKEHPDNVKSIAIPGVEFTGEMTKAINSFERDEVNE